jgi:hypothetical protein
MSHYAYVMAFSGKRPQNSTFLWQNGLFMKDNELQLGIR